MADKQSLTSEEWTKLLESPMVAGMEVSAAEPSGLWGALKEAFASSSALVAAKTDPSSSKLIKALVSDSETSEGRSEIKEALRKRFAGAKPADVVQRSLSSLEEVSRLLETKAPNEAAAFKAWLQGISQNVAEASKEGGFLGFGGVQVTDAEKATLADIHRTLGVTA
jgi:hypothetical protein